MHEDPILFVGDIHLGRRPTGLDEQLIQLGLDAHALGPAAAWQRTVDHALQVGARAVVLAGDVVESARDRFEAYPALEQGCRRLVDAGVSVVAVAGNHDSVALPRLTKRLEGVRLLGVGGRWERVVLPADGPRRPLVTLAGWSFPATHHRGDPLDAPGAAVALVRPDAGAFLVVLHADLDATGSPYAPTRRARLATLGADAVLVGHVHAPDALDRQPIGYLGSLCGLDAGEPGVRGPWEVRVGGGVRLSQVDLAPLRFANLVVDLDAAAAPEPGHVREEADADALHAAIQQAAEEVAPASPCLVQIARVQVRGRGLARGAVEALGLPFTLPARADRCPTIVTRVDDATLPLLDLDTLAEGTTPTARMARTLRTVLAGGADETALRDAAERHLARVGTGMLEHNVDLPPPDLDALLAAAARRALDALLDTREGAQP